MTNHKSIETAANVEAKHHAVNESAETSQRNSLELDTQSLFGITMHSVVVDQVLEAVDQRISERNPGYIVTPNVDHVCRYATDSKFRRAYHDSFLVVPDGVPIMWASRLLGRPLHQKISGSDLLIWLSEFAAKRGHSVFLLGAAEGVQMRQH